MKPATPEEKIIRRMAHGKAVLMGITIRDAVYKALELWVKEETSDGSERGH